MPISVHDSEMRDAFSRLKHEVFVRGAPWRWEQSERPDISSCALHVKLGCFVTPVWDSETQVVAFKVTRNSSGPGPKLFFNHIKALDWAVESVQLPNGVHVPEPA